MDETTNQLLVVELQTLYPHFHTLRDQAIEILEIGSLDTKITSANVIDCLVVNHETAIRVFQCGVGGEDRIVWLNHRGCVLGSRVDDKFEFALLAVVNRETLHQQSTKPRASATAEGVGDQKALETGAVIGNPSNFVQDLVDQLFADSVVTTSIVVGSILFSSDHLLWVEETSICAGADLIDDIGLEIAVDGARDVLALT